MTMKNMIERYIYDVVRRLPEADREEVSRELQANIYDMLSEQPSNAEIESVLHNLGAPATLAEEYRQNPRYLISPVIYDDYIRTLKWLIPLIAVILFFVGLVLGVIQTTSNNQTIEVTDLFANIFSSAFEMSFFGALQVLLWTTIGFVVADRTQDNKKERSWKIADLPEIPEHLNKRIPLSDTIVELVLAIVFSVIFVLFCSGYLNFTYLIRDGDTIVRQIFSPEFLRLCIPATIATCILSCTEGLAKLKDRSWTIFVCAVYLVCNLATMGISIFVLSQKNIFSTEFISYINSKNWGDLDLLSWFGNPIGVKNIILAIIIIATLIGCVVSIYKTIRNYTYENK